MRERKKNRLIEYDYSNPGAYFVTLCVHTREFAFGEIVDGQMKLNKCGEIANNCWLELPQHYPNCQLDEFIIMPNHMHGIVVITECRERFETVPYETIVNKNGVVQICSTIKDKKHHGLPEMMRGFKTFSSRHINEIYRDLYFRWQKSYHDRIIRNSIELNRIREYIQTNPA